MPETTTTPLGGFEPVFAAPPGANSLRVSPAIRAATFTIFYDGQFAGTGFAIGPRLIMTAGHHFKTTLNDPGLLRLRADGHRGRREEHTVGVAYVQKDRVRDLLIMWPEEDVPFVPLRAWRPAVGSRVLTLYATPPPPHQKLVESPGTVSAVGDRLCRSNGTVTTHGASGAPVLDSFGEFIIGLHISVSNSAADGSWVSEFAPSAAVVGMLRDAGVDPAVPYRVEDEEPPTSSSKSTAAVKKSGVATPAPSTGKRKSTGKETGAIKSAKTDKRATPKSASKKPGQSTAAASPTVRKKLFASAKGKKATMSGTAAPKAGKAAPKTKGSAKASTSKKKT